MQIAIFLLYACGFSVVLTSGLTADDMWNSNIQAAPYLNGPGPFQVMAGQWKMWLEAGRIFPFSNYAAVLFAWIPSVSAYKGCILLMTYLSNLISSICLRKITGSKTIQITYMLLFPVLIQLTPEFDSGLYCYHMLIQMVATWCFLALWMQLQYLYTNRKRYAAGAGIFFFIALGTYEVAFPFLLVLLWVTYRQIGVWKQTWKRTAPLLLIFGGMLSANLIARLLAADNSYHGVSVSLQAKDVFITLLKQCSTCLPLGRYLCSALKYCVPYSDVYPYTWKGIIENLQPVDYVTVLLFGFIFIRNELQYRQESKLSGKDLRTLLVLGGLVFVLPGCLIAVSEKYQHTIAWAGGHLPAYMQSMGFAILIAGVYVWLKERLSGWKQSLVIYGCLLVAGVVLILNLASGRAGVEYRNQFHKYPQETLTAASQAGFFDAVAENEGTPVFGIEDYIYNKQNSAEFYSKLAGKRMYALTQEEMLAVCRRQGGRLMLPDETEAADKEYYAVSNYSDWKRSVLWMGICTEAEYQEMEDTFQWVMLRNPQVYLRGEPEWDIPSDWQLLREGENYRIYQLTGDYQVKNGTEILKKDDDDKKS